jgi:DNA-binding MurR/RpiR family transcriptional regulator
MRFIRVGRKCLLFHDQSVQIMMATNLTAGDVVIGISDSGRTDAIVDAADRAVARRGHDRGDVRCGFTAGRGVRGGAVHRDHSRGRAVWRIGHLQVGQLLVIDALYATFAARRFDETLGHLEETYTAAIQHSRMA